MACNNKDILIFSSSTCNICILITRDRFKIFLKCESLFNCACLFPNQIIRVWSFVTVYFFAAARCSKLRLRYSWYIFNPRASQSADICSANKAARAEMLVCARSILILASRSMVSRRSDQKVSAPCRDAGRRHRRRYRRRRDTRMPR